MLLLLQVIGCAELAGFLAVGAYLIFTGPHTKPVAPRSRQAWRTLGGLAIACLMLAACGGGSAGGVSDVAPSSPVGTSTGPTCDASGNCTGASGAPVCPNGSSGPPPTCTATPPPTLAACPVGNTILFISTCSCPDGDVNGSSCFVPQPPPAAPPPPVTVAPTASLAAAPASVDPGGNSVLTWSSTGATLCQGAAGWPSSGQLSIGGFVNTGPLTATTSYSIVCGGAGGNTTASVTVVVGENPAPPPGGPCSPPGASTPAEVCNPPAGTVTVQLTLSPTTVVDNANGCPDPAGNSCVATVGIAATSSIANDPVLCYVPPNSPAQYLTTSSFEVGPYAPASDGPQVVTVACYDEFTATASASVTLTVTPPAAPVPPVFNGVSNGDGTWSFTWSTPQTGAGCYVEEFSNGGPWSAGVALTPGGTTSGTAASPPMLPSYSPYTFVLTCGGVALPGVTNITVTQ